MKTILVWFAATAALFGVQAAVAQGLPRAQPEEVGLSSERLGRSPKCSGTTQQRARCRAPCC